MFERVLVANRSEIALRVIRAARSLGIATAVVAADPDLESLPARRADEVVHLPGTAPGETYLDIDRVVQAAVDVGADCLHPGYGFLAENPDLVRACDKAGVDFIGPPAEAMDELGDKVQAKAIFEAAGVPVLPGTDGPVADVDEARAAAEAFGYPVLVKAKAGGGGRGMRRVDDGEALEAAFDQARREAEGAFGDPDVYLEKLIEDPRHIEVQVLAAPGQAVHLFERECSVQRRHQKLLEEAPSPVVDAATRADLGAWACDGLVEAGYTNAGTVEFLRDADGQLHFMEVNTRIQVEHPVTEMVTGKDLVRAQFQVAADGELPWSQDDISLEGHAIECRINAEDAYRGFLPSPGPVRHLVLPGGPGVRVDTALFPGYTVPKAYDSLVAKLVCHGADRAHAIRRSLDALDEFRLKGFPTTIPFHQRLLRHDPVVAGEMHTGLVDDWWSGVTPPKDLSPRQLAAFLAAAGHGRSRRRPTPTTAWRRAGLAEGRREGGPLEAAGGAGGAGGTGGTWGSRGPGHRSSGGPGPFEEVGRP